MTGDWYLVKHLEAHEGSRPYRCDYDGCKKGFETQELLNAHWEHVHIGDVSVYKCPKCEKGSSTCYTKKRKFSIVRDVSLFSDQTNRGKKEEGKDIYGIVYINGADINICV